MVRGALARLFERSKTRTRRGGRFRPRLDAIEDRIVLSVFTWSGDESTAWSNPANWQEGGVPGAADTAIFDDTATQFQSSVDAAFAGNVAALEIRWTNANATITLERTLAAADLQMESGKVAGAFDFTVDGGKWSGGTISTSKFIVSAGGELVIDGIDLKTIGGTFENFGTTRWLEGDVIHASGSKIANNKPSGIFEANNHAQWLQENDGAGFFNEGTFRKIGDAGSTTFDIAFYGLKTAMADIQVGTLNLTRNGKHVGNMLIAENATVLCSNGYLLDGVTIQGDGFFHVTGNDQVWVANGVKVDNLRLDGGELGYLGALTFFDTFVWTGGSLIGKTDIAIGATMIISGDSPKSIQFGAPLNNLGTTIWQDSGSISLGGVWTNLAGATFDAQGDGLIYSFGNGSFVNSGTFRKSAGVKTTMQTLFTNTGNVESQAGIIELYRGSSGPGNNTFTIGPGALVDLVDYTLHDTTAVGDGTLRITGAGVVAMKGQVNVDRIEQAHGNVLINEGNLVVHDEMTWVRGFITGVAPFQIEIAPEAVLNIVGEQGRVLSGNIVNFGTTFWTGSGTVTVTNGKTFTNKPGAVFHIQGSAALTSAGTFRNEGRLRRFEPNGTPTRIDTTLINTGVIEVLSGMISMGKLFNNAGTLVIANGCTFSTDQTYTQAAGGLVTLRNGTLIAKNGLTIQAGTVRGNGTIQGNVLSSGIFAPGIIGGIGTIQIIGTYSQVGNGTLMIDIAGLGAGTGHDQLIVTGAASLDGTLSVALKNGYQPVGGASFEILKSAADSGAFSILNGDGNLFDVAYNPDNVTLVAKGSRVKLPRAEAPPGLRKLARAESAQAALETDKSFDIQRGRGFNKRSARSRS